jgi:hypothetical protein
MSWLKLTSNSLYLMRGGTNTCIDKIDLAAIPGSDREFKLSIPAEWLNGSDSHNVVVVDVGSTEAVPQSRNSFKSDSVFDRILERATWGAAPPTSRFEIVPQSRFIVIHHTEGKPTSGGEAHAKKMVKGIQSFHMAPEPKGNGWSDIGYNFINSTDGILLEGRSGSLAEAIKGNTVRGAHAGSNEGNRSPGVSNEGNFMTKEMNKTQWSSLVEMCAALCQSCDIDPAQIRGHRDFAVTDCPGDWPYSKLPELIQDVAKRLVS